MKLTDFYRGFSQALACNVSCRNKDAVGRYLEGRVNPTDMSIDELYTVMNDILVPLTRSTDTALATDARDQVGHFERIIASKKTPAA